MTRGSAWRVVTPDDVPTVEAFLQEHIETSVFLIANLRRFGPSGGPHPYAMRYWCRGNPIDGVIAQSTAGMVMAQCPGHDAWRPALACLEAPVTGLIGDGFQIHALRDAAGWTDAATTLDADEVLYALDLTRIVPQPGPGHLRPLQEEDRERILPWRIDYDVNTLGVPLDEAKAKAPAEFSDYIKADSHRVLWDGDTPLSMTGFNASVDDLVQVGGVYTPPDRRGLGLARRAVALHLQEARLGGAVRSILFANDPSAQAAYEAVGFEPIGRFALISFTAQQALA